MQTKVGDVNFETLARIGRIEQAVKTMQEAIDTLQAELTDIKSQSAKPAEKRQTLSLRKSNA